jgi:hypothetical protein
MKKVDWNTLGTVMSAIVAAVALGVALKPELTRRPTEFRVDGRRVMILDNLGKELESRVLGDTDWVIAATLEEQTNWEADRLALIVFNRRLNQSFGFWIGASSTWCQRTRSNQERRFLRILCKVISSHKIAQITNGPRHVLRDTFRR